MVRKIRKKPIFTSRRVEGKLETHPDGYGFVLNENRSEGDIFIPRGKLLDAVQGDLVRAEIERRNRRGKPEGRVVEVLERGRNEVVGVFKIKGGEHWVVPNDPKMAFRLRIGPNGDPSPKEGEMVVAKIVRYPKAGRGPDGKITKILGEAYAPLLDTRMVVEEFGLPCDFSPELLYESERIPEEVPESVISGRTDLRNEVIFTIDGETARDFDDAVSIFRHPGGDYQLGVHIADVSAYVPWDSLLDREAFQRGTSVYFPDRVVPMFPERLSNGICSLVPRADRLTFTVDMRIDSEGTIRSFELFESVIRSRARLTYTEVWDILRLQGETESRDPRIVDALFLLKEIALILRDRRMKRGSIDFDLPEPLILFDPDGEISTIVTEERNLAHRIIEECMLAANETVAGHLARSGHPSIYRIHEIPSAEKIADFQFFIAGLGYSLKGFPNKVTPLSFQDVLNRSEGKPEKRLVNHLMLRSMKQAVYSVTNPGHFGLGAECYTHFTSPIRRYPDLMVHRILKGYRDPESRGKFSAVLKRRLAAIADHCSTRERRAVNAEREAMTLKKVRFMAGKIGLEFDGHISGVTSFGLFVELTDIFVEGLVPLVTLKDYYGWDPKRHRLTGERFRRVFQPGEPVRIRVESASIEKREIRFQLLNEIPPRNPAPDKKPVRSRYR